MLSFAAIRVRLESFIQARPNLLGRVSPRTDCLLARGLSRPLGGARAVLRNRRGIWWKKASRRTAHGHGLESLNKHTWKNTMRDSTSTCGSRQWRHTCLNCAIPFGSGMGESWRQHVAQLCLSLCDTHRMLANHLRPIPSWPPLSPLTVTGSRIQAIAGKQ